MGGQCEVECNLHDGWIFLMLPRRCGKFQCIWEGVKGEGPSGPYYALTGQEKCIKILLIQRLGIPNTFSVH